MSSATDTTVPWQVPAYWAPDSVAIRLDHCLCDPESLMALQGHA